MAIRVFGTAYGRLYDYECSLIEKDEYTIRLKTISDPPHEIIGRIRHVGVKLDSPPLDGGSIILNILVDGKFVALAKYQKRGEDIVLYMHEY